MAAVRLLLAAIVASAAAPVTAEAAAAAPCRWCCDGGVAVDAPLTLPCAVRARLAQAPLDLTAVVWAPPSLDEPRRAIAAVATPVTRKPAPVPAPVLPRAPKTSPPT